MKAAGKVPNSYWTFASPKDSTPANRDTSALFALIPSPRGGGLLDKLESCGP
jgi:hypothetical protein